MVRRDADRGDARRRPARAQERKWRFPRLRAAGVCGPRGNLHSRDADRRGAARGRDRCVREKEHQPLALGALLALAVPWLWVVSPALIVAPLVPVGYLAWRYWNGNVQAALLAAVAAAVLVWGLTELAALPAHMATHAHAVAIDPRLAEATWGAFTQKSSTNSIAGWMLRVPTWAGLLLLLTFCSPMHEAPQPMRGSSALLLAVICTLLPFVGQFYGDRAGGWLMIDFRAYYCASLAQRRR